MTPKDYALIANALKEAYSESKEYDASCLMWYRSVTKICEALAGDNPRFNEEQFRKACNPEPKG